MRLVRYGSPGNERPGLLDAEGGVRSLDGIVDDIDGALFGTDRWAALRSVDPVSLARVDSGVRLGPCVGGVRNFVAVGLNYSDHAEESGFDVPTEPVLFAKAPSCIVGPDDDIVMPPGSSKTDWEVEIVVVIGRTANRVSEAEAHDYIAGFCLCNDVSERAMQHEGTGQWIKGKGCPTFGPIGPWLVTADEIPDLYGIELYLDVNGNRMQSGSTKTMIFDFAYIVSYVSRFMTLEPGDLITTGTPPGVGMGMKPPKYLAAGDVVTLGADGLGAQHHQVVAA